MIIGIIGHEGNVGSRLIKRGHNYVGLACDVTNENSIKRAIAKEKPDVIVSLAAVSDVDACELQENFEEVYDVNIMGVSNLGEATQKKKIPTVIISTDHVFSGRTFRDKELKRWIKRGAYKESYIRFSPVNFYGSSKVEAEYLAHEFDYMKIIRTSYLFSRERLYPLNKSYPAFMKRSFMHIDHFVDALHYYLHHVNEMPKILHISGSETVSWRKFIKACPDRHDAKFHYRDNKKFTPRPHKAGLRTDLSAKLGIPQYSYKDGIELL